MKRDIELSVNGRSYIVSVNPNDTLLKVLRDELGLTGTKNGCSAGDCGACTVLIDGHAFNSCLVLAIRASGKEITTVEGLEVDGRLHPLQESFIEHGAVQCGYCTPGILMSSVALLKENPNPSEEDIRVALAGNLCRCTGYQKIIRAILSVVDKGLQV